MTQEELDALMNSDLDEMELDEEENSQDDIIMKENLSDIDIDEVNNKDDCEKNESSEECDESIIPPKATQDNRVVEQLDKVTKDSEKKATEIFDMLDGVSEYIANVENEAINVINILKDNSELFEKLSNHFQEVETFKEFYEKNSQAIPLVEDIIEKSQMSSDDILTIMDTMQYQDIHRQKIERVINIMRSLLRYMNTLFGSHIKDEERVSSAQHIIGDTDTDDVVTDEDIEALLNTFGKK